MLFKDFNTGLLFYTLLLVATAGIAVYLLIISGKLRRLKSHAEEILNTVSKDIIDGINYAKALQEATFPDKARLKEYFEDVFIILKPMEAVSGDFHWFGNVGGRIYLAVVDCHGHGVPGAFLSMLGNTLLSQIIIEEKIKMPNEILNKINSKLAGILSNIKKTEVEKELMNVGICMVDYDSRKIYYSGAKHTLYFVNDGRFREIEGDKHSVGMADNEKTSVFIGHEIDIKGSLTLYLTSEGFNYEVASADSQVASLQMINLILKIGSLPFAEQNNAITRELEKYDYKQIQTDDFTIIGLLVR